MTDKMRGAVGMGKVIPLYFKEKVRQVFDMDDVQEILFYHLS